jgi:fluoride exporter
MKLATIALGGAFGAYCRYWFGIWFANRGNFQALPLAMVIVNLLGSFGLGIATALSTDYHMNIPIAITVGFFGAFTTFSTFSVEAMQLLRQRQYRNALFYIVISLFGSIAMFALAYMLL